ncbi:IPT/TIG domain-containing protein [Hymenobacter negativus]|uniref:IPT/TIG domain-containing protein n=1 Tax=Hymenobacter negativus TaxID=2795026 RepID=A0ABS3QLU4_9BACT|nr:IPT/TIG domain-containing protein [Hymenobacter negativus]MBO2012244.1 IPT/TIG domain-containing protein [Hymenobacter negativus]
MRPFYSFRRLVCQASALLLWPALCQASPFTPGNIVVARVGDGTAPLSGAATAVFLDEYTPSGTLVQTIDMPTSVGSVNRILTASGNATSELGLTRSVDGRYLVLTGYSAAPGTTGVITSLATDVARVIGRVAADGTFNTSTSVGDTFSGVSIRAAATVDGTSFYTVGGNSGVQYQAFGSVTSTPLDTAPTDIRGINIADGNLYISTAVSPYRGLSQVGTGLPTTGNQTVTALPGFPATTPGASPYSFYFADLSPTVPGVDVVYVSDDRSTAGGIQKWSLASGTWVLNGLIAGTPTSTIRGLNGSTTGTSVSLAATSVGSLFFMTDNSGYNTAPSLTALPTAIATAGTNTAFRGIAFAPVAPAPAIASFTPASGPVGTTVTVTGTNFANASAVTLNGVAVTGFTVVDAATITFVVPAGATSGTIAITTQGGTAVSTGTFTVIAPNPLPVISSLAPATAVAGSAAFTLTLNGTGFYSGSVISFNGTNLTTTFVSATQLTATVPATAVVTAGAYPVTVTNAAPGGGTSVASTFTVTVPAPTIASFTPATGGPGTTVTITGTNFTGATAVNIGSFAVPNYTVVSVTSITLVLPTGTGSVNGFLTVVTPGGTATSATPFSLVSAVVASQAMPGLTVFPNPATDRVTVALPQPGAATVALRDLAGRMVLAPATLAADQQLRLPASLAAGVYLLEVRQGNVTALRRIEKN